MARRTTKKTSVRLDLSNVGKAFEKGKEYAVQVAECTLETGEKAPYFSLKLKGVDDEYSESVMYHNASTSPESLWRLRPLMEAFGIEIPDGPMDISPDDFVGKTAMCSVFLDKYDGGSRVKPDEFWPLDDDAGDDGDGDFDLDDLSDEHITALAEAMKVKGTTVARQRSALAKLDQDEVEAAYKDLEAEGGDEFDLEALDDDQIKALGEALEVKAKTVARIRAALEKLDADEVKEAFEGLAEDEPEEEAAEFDIDSLDNDQLLELAEALEVSATKPALIKRAIAKLDQDDVAAAWADLQEPEEEPAPKGKGKAAASKKSGKGAKVSEDEVNEMNEDELIELIELHSLDVDLSEAKTLRKKRTLMLDALEENDLIAD